MSTQRPLVLVTGASSGIGEAFAKIIAADGCDLLLVARRTERLDALKAEIGGETHTLPLDITAPGAGDELDAELARLGRPVDILVNNAGFGKAGPFAGSDRADQLGMVDLNVRALVDLTHRYLPGMVERRTGGVLNVASTAAFQPGPNVAVYYASKAFVLSFSEALSEEVRGSGVTISALCPGPTHSEFGAISGMATHRVFRPSFLKTSEAVARQGWAGFRAGRRVVVTGALNKMTAAGGRVLPKGVVLRMVKRLQTDR
ncbi:SDR family oxidoreductase [Acuticoccus sp. M5D2P5]|uniref:SDR family NAD(P)-dependent oxidoreductase n=1 Tax=Acuticoccus kalidii TaxID=2910977 RepID=UPI001F44BBAC|nr:SDR family oxidoreductase [Acuticoccus kalidii]MCF3933608.1 SDR family oxidoreductase [Acuticoccus kalidii]